MSLLSKVKSWFYESHTTEQKVSARHARLAGVPVNADEAEVKLKKWVRSTLSTAPWAALAIILFMLFAQGAVASGALAYGLMKAAIAVLVTVIADETMFNGLTIPKDSPWLPMMRRSLVFMGVCWLMAVT